MGKRIYVGSLPPTADEETLRSLFAQHGQVSEVNMVADQVTGRAKGFAFVEMADAGEADEAIYRLNGRVMRGWALLVNEARSP